MSSIDSGSAKKPGRTPASPTPGGTAAKPRPTPTTKEVVSSEVDEHGNITIHYSDGSMEVRQGGQ